MKWDLWWNLCREVNSQVKIWFWQNVSSPILTGGPLYWQSYFVKLITQVDSIKVGLQVSGVCNWWLDEPQWHFGGFPGDGACDGASLHASRLGIVLMILLPCAVPALCRGPFPFALNGTFAPQFSWGFSGSLCSVCELLELVPSFQLNTPIGRNQECRKS